MTTNLTDRSRRHPLTPFREDHTSMFHIENRYQEIKERQSRYRVEAQRDRQADVPQRRFRHRLGESIIRIGHKVGGDEVCDARFDATTSA